jgi:hypothetical protein
VEVCLWMDGEGIVDLRALLDGNGEVEEALEGRGFTLGFAGGEFLLFYAAPLYLLCVGLERLFILAALRSI